MKKCHIKIDAIKGRGVYAAEFIKRGKVIEVCHILLIPAKDVPLALDPYVFSYNRNHIALALGNGSLFNHAESPNAFCFFDYKVKTLTFMAKKDIHFHQEITINYGYTKAEKKKFGIV